VLKLVSSSGLSKIEDDGAADVRIGERSFKISRQFVEDVRREPLSHDIASLRKPLLIMHAPRDETVGIENATEIFSSPWTGQTTCLPIGRTPRSRVKRWRAGCRATCRRTRPRRTTSAATCVSWKPGRAGSRTLCAQAGIGSLRTSPKKWLA